MARADAYSTEGARSADMKHQSWDRDDTEVNWLTTNAHKTRDYRLFDHLAGRSGVRADEDGAFFPE